MKFKENIKKGKFGKIVQYPNFSGDRISINNTGLRPRNPNWYEVRFIIAENKARLGKYKECLLTK